MTIMKGLQVTTPSAFEIEMAREFAAPRQLIYDAHTQPELVKLWLLGPDGWTMPVCEIDLRVGGRYRYVWRKEKTGVTMATGGKFLEIDGPERLVSTEKFEDPWYEGQSVNTLLFVENEGGTKLIQTMRFESQKVRDEVLKTGMESGVGRSYDRLEEMVHASA